MSNADNHLKFMLQKYLSQPAHYEEGRTLTNLRCCGSRVRLGDSNNVFLVTDGETTIPYNIISCHSVWACPTCAPIVMAKKGTDIACAIDAMYSFYKLSPFMVTFTLPHSSDMSCEATFQILKEAWRYFAKSGCDKEKQKKYIVKSDTKKGKKGDIHTHKKTASIYNQFRENLSIVHSVKVYEFTWGENSWHPHIHALFWCPDEFFGPGNFLNKIVEQYEEKLVTCWWKAGKHQALKYYNKTNPNNIEENKAKVETLYAEEKKTPKTGHKSFFISKDEQGNVRKIQSSQYITDSWTGDQELTSHGKKGRNGHLTPFEILEKAETDAQNKDKWMNLFIEYALTTKNHRRVEFSHRKGFSFKELIAKWKETQTYRERLKKKDTKKPEGTRRKLVVCSFKSIQWSLLCFEDNHSPIPIRTVVMYMAQRASPENLPQIRQEIKNYVSKFGIEMNDPNEEEAILQMKFDLKTKFVNDIRIDEDGEITIIEPKPRKKICADVA